MPTSRLLLTLSLVVCAFLGRQGCTAQGDECVETYRVTKLTSAVYYYRCGWRGFWQCRGQRYYKTYTTAKRCCEGYEQVNGRCLRQSGPETRPPQTTPRPTELPMPTCGISVYDANKLIVGGSPAVPGEYPWLVSLGSSSHFCGGMIVDDRWILTAAHCVQKWWQTDYSNKYWVRVGEYDRYATDSQEVTLSIDRVVRHSAYSDITASDDIALIKTSRRIEFNDYVQPICLPNRYSTVPTNSAVDIAGWGVTEEGESAGASRYLLEARMQVVDLTVCRNTYGPLVINSRMLCVSDGYGNTRRSACNGDSGGPLIYRTNGIAFGVGITSFGASTGCAAGDPVVYTDVSDYVDWINQIRANY